MKSTFLKLQKSDFIKGLVMAVLGAVVGIIGPTIEAGQWIFDWQNIWHMAAGAAFAYLVKNLFTDSTSAAVKALQKQNVSITENK